MITKISLQMGMFFEAYQTFCVMDLFLLIIFKKFYSILFLFYAALWCDKASQ
jgi:hypothetical protein